MGVSTSTELIQGNIKYCLCHRSLEGLKEEQEEKRRMVKEKALKEEQKKEVKVDEQET